MIRFQANSLCAARSMHLHGPVCAPRRNSGYRGGARTRPRRLGLSHAALEKKNSYLISAFGNYQFHINALRKLRIALDLGGAGLPISLKFRNKHNAMRIPHRNGSAADFAFGEPDGKFTAHGGLSHFHFKLIFRISARYKRAGFQSGSSLDIDLRGAALGTDVSRDAARAVA